MYIEVYTMNNLLERIDVMDTNFRFNQAWANGKYNTFNMKFFNNELPKTIKFDISNTKDAVGDALCICSSNPTGAPDEIQVDGKYVSGFTIRMSNYFNNVTEKEAEELLLHEMIHIWQYSTQPQSSWQPNAHGQSFTNKMNEINRRSNGNYHITVTNDSSISARHDSSNINQKDMYQKTKNKSIVVMNNPDGKSDVAFKVFDNDADKNQFINQYAKMHDINIIGEAKPQDLDKYNAMFANVKSSKNTNWDGYYSMGNKAFDQAIKDGGITMKNSPNKFFTGCSNNQATFESTIRQLGLDALLEDAIIGMHKVIFDDDEDDNDGPKYVEKDWNTVSHLIDDIDDTEEVETR